VKHNEQAFFKSAVGTCVKDSACGRTTLDLVDHSFRIASWKRDG
jgi:hypothetical protein